MLYGRCERTLDRPAAVIKPLADRARGDACCLSPFHDALPLTVERQPTAACRVPALLRSCSPATILRVVIAIVVDTIKLVRWTWFGSHISPKPLETHPPACADANPAPAPTVEIRRVGVVTPRFHVKPRSIFWCAGLAMGEASLLLCRYIRLEASAAFTPTRDQTPGSNQAPHAAVAAAGPVNDRRLVMPHQPGLEGPQHQPSTETTPLQIHEWWHGYLAYRMILQEAMFA